MEEIEKEPISYPVQMVAAPAICSKFGHHDPMFTDDKAHQRYPMDPFGNLT